MKALLWLALAMSFLLFAGCQQSSTDNRRAAATDERRSTGPSSGPQDDEAEIKASLDKLSPEDRKLAEAQRFCAVENDNRLGSMGAPFKIMVKEQPVFLCCKGCAKEAQKNPEQTLAKVKELKAKYASAAASRNARE